MEGKIEKSKKFLSPFLTTIYEQRTTINVLHFRLKRAGSPNYRGLSFFAPGRKQAKPNLVVSEWPMNRLPNLPINHQTACPRKSQAGVKPYTFVPVLGISTTVEDSLQISFFMQNKPNFLDTQMNVKSFHTVDYENISNWTLSENKPNQTQFYPRSSYYHTQMMAHNMKGQFMSTSNNQRYVKTIGSKSNNDFCVMIMNQSQNDDFEFDLILNKDGGVSQILICACRHRPGQKSKW
ncbi:MAG: hypothetical protein ACYS30_15815 [Planctomycetota bacterium]